MKLTVFQLGVLSANCYIVADEEAKLCAVVDPGGEGKELAQWLDSQGLTPQCVFLTHYHFDHVDGAEDLASCYPGLPVYLHPGDADLPIRPGGKPTYWNKEYREGDTITVGSLSFRVFNTPGHTPGSVCLQVEDILITGDTLFLGSCGRTDFPGGSWDSMMTSLKRLAQMPGNPAVLPGHGGSSTLDGERARNAYMKEALAQ